MEETTTRLRSGEEMVLRVQEPPLTEYTEQAPERRLVNWIWADIKNEMLAGQMTRWLYTPYALGLLNGELVGSMAYYAPADTRDVGLIEFVETAEEQRGKGIASALLGRLVEKFTDEGGLALSLCTSNPIAGTLYENHGFWYTTGDGLRYLAPNAQDFEETYLEHCGMARVRDATWADLPRTSFLYNLREPRWLVKEYLTHAFGDMRYESHFVKLMRRIENQMGAYLVLENPRQRVVGAAALERFDTFQEQHSAILSFRVHPGYFDQTTELLNAAAEKATELSIGILQIYIGDRDEEQKELAREAGYAEEARLANRLRDGDEWVDTLVYTRVLTENPPPSRSENEYYGARNPWMNERIAAGRQPRKSAKT